MAGWSELPKELLHSISQHFEPCFDILHFRSVCRFWRSVVPSCSLQLYLRCFLPMFEIPHPFFAGDEFCYVEKIPVFVFIGFPQYTHTQDSAASCSSSSSSSSSSFNWWIGGIREQRYGHMNMLCPIDDLGIQYEYQFLLDARNCQFFSLGNVYRFFCPSWQIRWLTYRDEYLPEEAAMLYIDEKDEDFAVLVAHSNVSFAVFRTTEMTWTVLDTIREKCESMVSFKGKFYAIYENGKTLVIEVPLLNFYYLPGIGLVKGKKWLVQSGNELLLVEISPKILLHQVCVDRRRFRVFRLDEEAHRWVKIEDLGDRVLILGWFGKFCCSANVLPGFQGNCVIVDPDANGREALVLSLEDGSVKTVNSITGRPRIVQPYHKDREEAKRIRDVLKAGIGELLTAFGLG